MNTKSLALCTVLVTYILIVFGGYVASSESGMGCGPDWPLCNGVLVPVLRGETLVEYAHRVVGAVLGVLNLILWYKIVKKTGQAGPVRAAANWSLALLILQILFGALVVVLDLPSIVISAHLLIAMAYLALVMLVWRTVDRPLDVYAPVDGRNRTYIRHVHTILGLMLLTIAVGAYTKHETYGLSCGWLDCGESWFPESLPQTVQTIHRIAAVVAVAYIGLLAFWVMVRNERAGLKIRMLACAALAAAQIAAGILTVLYELDIAWAVIHLAIATALFACLVEVRIWLKLHGSSE